MEEVSYPKISPIVSVVTADIKVPKQTRTKEELSREYSDLAVRAGDLSFRLEVETQALPTFKELQEVYLKMDAICRERAAQLEVQNVEG